MLLALGAAALSCAPTSAKIIEKRIGYDHDGKKFEGVLVYDDEVKGKRPAMLMGPDWMGVSENSVNQAELVAGKRYAVFVADMYGVEATPKSPQQAGPAERQARNDVALTRARAAGRLSAPDNPNNVR